jgi:glycerate 2-kinase
VTAREELLAAYRAALDAVEPGAAVRRHLRREGSLLWAGDAPVDLARRRVWVVGAGKAAPRMARAVVEVLGDRLAGGALVTRYGHAERVAGLLVHEAGHPVPDVAGVAGANAVLDVCRAASADDLVVAVWSGGGSALLPLPRRGVSLSDLRRTTEVMLRSGAAIHDTNTLRRHLGVLSGGGLAARCSAPIVSLVLSDVTGDDLCAVASGPTAPDPTTWADCDAIIGRWNVRDQLPAAVIGLVARGLRGEAEETAKPGNPIFARVRNVVVGSNRIAVEAAAAFAHGSVLATDVTGEAATVGPTLVEAARAAGAGLHVAGGETTVTVRGAGKGGRSQTLALAAAMAIDGDPDVVVLAAGTDGSDGPTDAAGALVDGGTCARARAAGLDPADSLARDDAYPLLAATRDLVITGPTGTNVADLVLIRVVRASVPAR